MNVGWAHALLALVLLQRLSELLYARHNTQALLKRGGRETGSRHYPLFILLHGAWLATMFALTPPDPVPHNTYIALFAVLQGLRAWVLVTLGPHWTTRIITLAGVEPVAHAYTAKAGQKMGEGWATTTRTDGTLQWTYDGRPLYFYFADKRMGDKKGDGLGGVWHVVID